MKIAFIVYIGVKGQNGQDGFYEVVDVLWQGKKSLTPLT